MTRYRRLRLPGATYFFSVNLATRGIYTLTDNIDVLRWAYGATIAEQPIICDAMVVLPDHLHAFWTLPASHADFSNRWRKIKARLSRAVGGSVEPAIGKSRKRETGVWQRRFWEQLIRDDHDYDRHVRYCWGNPVKHG